MARPEIDNLLFTRPLADIVRHTDLIYFFEKKICVQFALIRVQFFFEKNHNFTKLRNSVSCSGEKARLGNKTAVTGEL
jgi:hypothetical protein